MMDRDGKHSPGDLPLANELTRRHFLGRSTVLASAAAIALQTGLARVAAQDATPGASPVTSPIAVDPERLDQLTNLSQVLCGGGRFDSTRSSILLQLIDTDSTLSAGLDELLATPPVEGQSLGSDTAQQTAQVILLFWYADVFDDAPLPDRGTAYYQLTAWQAMYTPSWAICKAFGGWADAPRTDPSIPVNS